MNGFIQEIINSLRNNILRTTLTGLTIAWGIILLVVLLGVGDGVKKGITNSINSIGAGKVEMTANLSVTQEAYGGYKKGRVLELTPRQFDLVREAIKNDLNAIEPYYSIITSIETNYGRSSVRYDTMTEREQSFNKKLLKGGRTFTREEHRRGDRVCLISERDVSRLFPSSKNPLGETIVINGISYKIVGIVDYPNPFVGEAVVPYNTAKMIKPNSFLTIKKLKLYPKSTKTEDLNRVETELVTYLRTMLRVSPEDESAIYVNSSSSTEEGMSKVFRGIDILLWIMGIGSLAIGTMGVSNIMSVTVQERMREIGIRKALGAKPRNILSMVLGESVFLSISFGLVGLFLGFWIIELINYLADKYEWATQYLPMGPSGSFMKVQAFSDPTVNLSVAIGALIVLVIAGLIAGFSPANKAIKVPAVIAMRDNK